MTANAASPPKPLSSWERFPRSADLPTQSPKYWVKEKDRYLRQLLIRDVEHSTGRPLIVFYSQLSEEINHTDPDDLSEMLSGISGRSADILLQTPGGSVDAAEKIISILKSYLDDYRVIVPSWAKSAGTVIALSSNKIILGVNSELGPIDPHWSTANGMVPCELIAQDPAFGWHLQQMAQMAVDRMIALSRDLLERGMMSARSAAEIDESIAKISASSGYKSHGAVIDYSEAHALGLDVEYWPPNDELWRRIWMLYCMYDHDAKAGSFGKIFEGNIFSMSRPITPTP